MTEKELAAALREPFAAHEIEWRVQSSGKTARGPWVRVLAYVDNRAMMERLDAVLGIGGWRNEFSYAPTGAVLCGLSLRINGEWVTKWDGANETDIEAAKGGISNAMKRAAVQWGIGRYLYNLEEGYARILGGDSRDGEYLKANPQKHGDALRWLPPELPVWALPGGSGNPATPPQRKSATTAEEQAAQDARDRRNRLDTLSVPGTKAHFGGHGGKRVSDVPSDALVQIIAKLREIDAEKNETKYTALTADMETVLDERREAGYGG
jgi:hypothetical protein